MNINQDSVFTGYVGTVPVTSHTIGDTHQEITSCRVNLKRSPYDPDKWVTVYTENNHQNFREKVLVGGHINFTGHKSQTFFRHKGQVTITGLVVTEFSFIPKAIPHSISLSPQEAFPLLFT